MSKLPFSSVANHRFLFSIVEKIRKIRLHARLTGAFLIVSLIPILVFTFFSIHVYSNSIRDKLSMATQQSVQLINTNLTTLLANYGDQLSTLSLQPEVQNAMRDDDLWQDPYGRYSLQKTLSTVSQKLPSSSHIPIKDFCLIHTDGVAVMNFGYVYLTEDTLSDLLDSVDHSPSYDYLSFVKNYSGEPLVSLSRKVYDEDLSSRHIGYIVIFFDASILQRATLPVELLGSTSNMVLADSSGVIIASQNQEESGHSLAGEAYFPELAETSKHSPGKVISLTAKEHSIVAIYNQNYDTYMIAVIPSSIINSEIQRVSRVIISLTIPLVLICLLLTLIVYQSITIPIGKVVSVYSSGHQTTARVRDPSPDELGFLARTIDDLADRNQQMLEQISADDRRKRELELEMLRYQINPHFLFNTLNTFKWIAALNDIPVLSNGISSLAGLLENTLVQKDELVTLDKEISCLKDYCTIQSLRYAGHFEMHYRIDPAVQQCLVPRFILQPLVENAIIHGTEGLDEVVNIVITASLSGDLLHITVEDDGSGFCVADVYNKHDAKFSGIGLSNIDHRLRLYYGAENCLQLQSQPGTGTCCQIRIPLSQIPTGGEPHV